MEVHHFGKSHLECHEMVDREFIACVRGIDNISLQEPSHNLKVVLIYLAQFLYKLLEHGGFLI